MTLEGLNPCHPPGARWTYSPVGSAFPIVGVGKASREIEDWYRSSHAATGISVEFIGCVFVVLFLGQLTLCGVGPCVFAANGCPLLRASCGCQAAVDRCLDVHECSGDVDGAVRVYVRACVVPRVTRVEGPLQQFLDDGIPTWEIVYGQDTATGMKGFWLRVLPESPKCDTMLCKSGLQVACVTRANTRRHCFFFVQLIRAFFHTCTAGYCGRAGPWAVVTPVARLVM